MANEKLREERYAAMMERLSKNGPLNIAYKALVAEGFNEGFKTGVALQQEKLERLSEALNSTTRFEINGLAVSRNQTNNSEDPYYPEYWCIYIGHKEYFFAKGEPTRRFHTPMEAFGVAVTLSSPTNEQEGDRNV